MIDDRPTVAERYAGAIESSHLEVLPGRCSVDYLVAAGWCQDGLGVRMFRLRTEYDTVRGEHTLAILNAADAMRMARSLRQVAQEMSQRAAGEADTQKAGRIILDAASTSKNAKAIVDGAIDAAKTARALMMVHLKSLPEARVALHGFARTHAIRKRFLGVPKYRDQELRRNEVVASVAGRVLDIWIDPACPHCAGRGFNGGYREPVVICQECDGSTNRISGRRGERFAASEAAHQFGLSLMDEIDRKAARVAAAMRRFTSQSTWADSAVSRDARARLERRLVELRSAEAQKD